MNKELVTAFFSLLLSEKNASSYITNSFCIKKKSIDEPHARYGVKAHLEV